MIASLTFESSFSYFYKCALYVSTGDEAIRKMRKTAQRFNTEIENLDKPDLFSSVCLQLERFRQMCYPEDLKAEIGLRPARSAEVILLHCV